MSAGATIYENGTYLAHVPEWHREDAPFKAGCIAGMLSRHPLIAKASVCEIGCGAGGILSQLQTLWPRASFVGYDISPQAHGLSAEFASERCRFVLGDAFEDRTSYDVALVIDVIEHVEDCFAFLRQCREKAEIKLYHIPLDVHCSAILRGRNAWDSVGHLHLFSIESALKTLAHAGHRIVDYALTSGALGSPIRCARTRVANLVRRALPDRLAARTIGGYSLLALTQ